VAIPDLRPLPVSSRRPSADLQDTIAQCRERQSWYRSYALRSGGSSGGAGVALVGSMTTSTPPADAADELRAVLSFDVSPAARGSNFVDAQRRLALHAEDAGVLVMTSGVVGSATRRKLKPREFRGLALADRLAPVVFVNGADTKAVQLFTLAFELAHLWLGASGVSNLSLRDSPAGPVEQWCAEVALELLVPAEELRANYRVAESAESQLKRLTRKFKVSPLVALRALRDAELVDDGPFRSLYRAELAVLEAAAAARKPGGGNFYATQPVRVSRRFARALVSSTLEGRTADSDAFRMLGFSKRSTLEELGRRLGV
jgi:Zn-dependent peptidase ImmA (M78 family)